jgi:hypothetical protein
MAETQTRVSCPACGAGRPAEIASLADRPPCPECGASGIAIELGIAEEVNVAQGITVGIRPVDQARDWRRTWDDITTQLAEIATPRAEQLSGDAVKAAAAELEAFFVRAYQLKDALNAEPSAGAEDAINTDPTLALLADLANLVKHYNLKTTRSGSKPTIDSIAGEQAGSGERGWRLRMEISHMGKTIDGLDFAAQAVGAWERQLKGWGMI